MLVNQMRPLAALAVLILAACEPTNMYVAHHTVVGVNAALNNERTSGHLVIGYDRKFVTIVPKSVPYGDDPDSRDVMAVLSCSELEVEGIFLSKFVEYLATGVAAKKLAKKIGEEGGAGGIFNCLDDVAPEAQQSNGN